MKTYEVEIERDGQAWLASVPAVDGCFTQGKTIGQARERIMEALELCLEGKRKAPFELSVQVKLPAPARKALAAALESRELAERTANEAREATLRAALVMEERGISRRDAAELLGVSHQRIQQLVAAK